MYSSEASFYQLGHHNNIDDLALDLALVAYGLLGEVDKLWTQHILDGCGKMSFLHVWDGEQFNERWALLKQADWYTAWSGCTTNDEESEGLPVLSVAQPQADIVLIPWASQFAEGDRIRDALVAWGISGSSYFDLTNISLQSTLSKLDGFAAECGVEGFKCVELEEDSEAEHTLVHLSASNPNQLAAFKLALEMMGGI